MENYNAYFIGIIVPVLSYLLQIYPRFFNKYFGVDVWTRMLEIEHVKNAKHKIPGKVKKGFIIEGYFDYPIVFPWIFSFFKKNTLLHIQGFISPIFDVLQNYLVFIIALSLTNNLSIAIIAQAIYALTPILPIENSYMTPRSMGYLNFTLAFYPLLLFSLNGNIIFIIVGILFSTLLFIVHRFAVQSLLFISVFFSLYELNPLYIASFIFAAILAIIITKGYYLRVAKGHLSNIYFWVINYKYRFAHQVYGNKNNHKQDWVGTIYKLLSAFSPIFLFIMSIWTISGFLYPVIIHTTNIPILESTILMKLSIWIIFFYVFGAIVLKFKRLIPIGEGQRYLEMATVPASILSSVIIMSLIQYYGPIASIGTILLLLGNLMMIVYIQIKGIIADKNRSLTKELQSVYDYINKQKGRPRIMCIPHQITTMTVYNTKADVLVNADNPGLLKLSSFFPILHKSLDELKKEYKLDYLLLRESFVPKKDLKVTKKKVVFTSGDIHLIEL